MGAFCGKGLFTAVATSFIYIVSKSEIDISNGVAGILQTPDLCTACFVPDQKNGSTGPYLTPPPHHLMPRCRVQGARVEASRQAWLVRRQLSFLPVHLSPSVRLRNVGSPRSPSRGWRRGNATRCAYLCTEEAGDITDDDGEQRIRLCFPSVKTESTPRKCFP